MSTPREHLRPDESAKNRKDESVGAHQDWTKTQNGVFHDWRFKTGDQKLASELLGRTAERIDEIERELKHRRDPRGTNERSSEVELQQLSLDQLKYELENARLLIGDIKRFGVRLAISCKLDDPAIQTLWVDKLLKCGMPAEEIARIIADNYVKERAEFSGSSFIFQVDGEIKDAQLFIGGENIIDFFRFGREGYDRRDQYSDLGKILQPGSGVDQVIIISPSEKETGPHEVSENWLHIFTRDPNDPTQITELCIRIDCTPVQLAQIQVILSRGSMSETPQTFDDRIFHSAATAVGIPDIIAAVNSVLGSDKSDGSGSNSGGGFAAQLEQNLNDFAQRQYIDAWVTDRLQQQILQMMMGHSDQATLASALVDAVAGMRDRIISGVNMESWFNGSRNQIPQAEAQPYIAALGIAPESVAGFSIFAQEFVHIGNTRASTSSPLSEQSPSSNFNLDSNQPFRNSSFDPNRITNIDQGVVITSQMFGITTPLSTSREASPEGLIRATGTSKAEVLAGRTIEFKDIGQRTPTQLIQLGLTLTKVSETTARLEILERAIDSALTRVNLARAHGHDTLPESLRNMDALLSHQIQLDDQYILTQSANTPPQSIATTEPSTTAYLDSTTNHTLAFSSSLTSGNTDSDSIPLQHHLDAANQTRNGSSIGSYLQFDSVGKTESVGVQNTSPVLIQDNQTAALVVTQNVAVGQSDSEFQHLVVNQAQSISAHSTRVATRTHETATYELTSSVSSRSILDSRQETHVEQSIPTRYLDRPLQTTESGINPRFRSRESATSSAGMITAPTTDTVVVAIGTNNQARNSSAATARRKKLDRLLNELRQQAIRQGLDVAQILSARQRLRAHKLYREGVLLALLDALNINYSLRTKIFEEIALAADEHAEILRLEKTIHEIQSAKIAFEAI